MRLRHNFKPGDKIVHKQSGLQPGHTAEFFYSTTGTKAGEVLTVLRTDINEVQVRLGGPYWNAGRFELAPTKAPAPSLADDLRLPPQGRTVLTHMRKQGSISAADAMLSYGMTSAVLTRRVCDIENIGYSVVRESKKHPTSGRRYTRYSLEA